MVTLSSHPTVPSDVQFRDLGGEAVLLHVGTGRYFGLDEAGTRIWSLLAESGDLAEVHRRMIAVYQVAPAQLERDILAFVETLSKQGLLTLDEQGP